MSRNLRKFQDAPNACRCQAIVRLKDKTTAQCGRYRKQGVHCLQHARLRRDESTRKVTEMPA